MEVNKGEAERCRDMGAEALRRGQNPRAAKLLKKSLQLYPLPGVKALLGQAERRIEAETRQGGGGAAGTGPAGDENSSAAANGSGGSAAGAGSGRRGGGTAAAPPPSSRGFARAASSASTASSAAGMGACGRQYTEEQERIVAAVLSAKEGGRGAHYRVLGVEQGANEGALKKAYRKKALKLHPDKNAAPKADDAFKAVGLAYATLSDPQKRAVYDRYGDEDPDNRGSSGPGGMRHGQGNMHFNGQEVNPEEIFNMFFGGMGGGAPGGARGFGGQGVRFSTGGFAAGGMPRQRGGAQRQREPEQPGLMQFAQFLPIILLFLLSFLNFPGDGGSGSTGGNAYFSLTHSPPFTNPLKTELSQVREIPYFVTDKFMRTYYRDRFQRAQVERMVETSYEKYLTAECKNQQIYKHQLERNARDRKGLTPEDRERQLKKAAGFELTRCTELHGLFPRSKRGSSGWSR